MIGHAIFKYSDCHMTMQRDIHMIAMSFTKKENDLRKHCLKAVTFNKTLNAYPLSTLHHMGYSQVEMQRIVGLMLEKKIVSSSTIVKDPMITIWQ